MSQIHNVKNVSHNIFTICKKKVSYKSIFSKLLDTTRYYTGNLDFGFEGKMG
jgi:hypothetical protein